MFASFDSAIMSKELLINSTASITLQSFDLYQQKVLEILKENASLQSQLTKLRAEIVELRNAKLQLEATLSDREADLDRMTNALSKNMTESVEVLKSLQNDAKEKKKMSDIQYELDVCLSCKRSLERDRMLQRNENQRLACLNSQLSQEVLTLKHHNSRGRPK